MKNTVNDLAKYLGTIGVVLLGDPQEGDGGHETGHQGESYWYY